MRSVVIALLVAGAAPAAAGVLASVACVAAAAAQQVPRLEPLARIGCVECEGPELFAGIQAIAVGDERVYVIDRAAPFIRIFSLAGRPLRAFGRLGSGPGELRLPLGVAPRSGGQLDVYDMSLRRHTRYDATGAVIEMRPVSGFTALVASAPGTGHMLLLQTDFTSTDQPILRLADGAAEPVRLVTLTAEFPRLEPGEHARTPAFAAAPNGGFAVGDGIVEYRIRRFDTEGRRLGDIVRSLPRQRKTAEELAAERERLQRRAGRMGEMLRAEGGSRASIAPREERNHFNIDALAYDDAGRLWVRTERGGPNATVFDLFDAEGAFIGELRVGARLGKFAVHAAVLAARVTDEDEVEFVQLWRLR